MRIMTRSEWGARPFKRPRTRVPITSRRYAVFHYPGAGTPPKNIRDYAKWIERIHMDEKDWSGVGYNFFISHGQVAEGCGRDIVGAHSPPRNRDGIGINIWTSNGVPLPGDLDLARDLYEQLCAQAGRRLIPWWHGRDHPTACPGPHLIAWVKAGMPRTSNQKPGGGAPANEPADTRTELERWLDTMDYEKLLDDIQGRVYLGAAGVMADSNDRLAAQAQVGANRAINSPAIPGRDDEWGVTTRDTIHRTMFRANHIAAELAGLRAAVEALAKAQGVDPAEVGRIVKAAVEDALGSLEAEVKLTIDNEKV